MRVIITGGSGYIGSHTAAEAADRHAIASIDNHCGASVPKGSKSIIDRVRNLAGKYIPEWQADVRDEGQIDMIFAAWQPDAVIHLAGLKDSAKSVKVPDEYYDNNINGLKSIMKAMSKHNCRTLIFSSSAAVYGEPMQLPIEEDHPCNPVSPYAWTKLQSERMISDWASESGRRAISLRYFNPGGCHASGLIGEFGALHGNNLLPSLARAALSVDRVITIYGKDHPTVDGTPLRDFVHIADLASAHVAALEKSAALKGHHIFNIGTGSGTTVLQMVHLFSKIGGNPVLHNFAGRRQGDISISVADCSKARHVLGWRAEKSVTELVDSCLWWQAHAHDRIIQ